MNALNKQFNERYYATFGSYPGQGAFLSWYALMAIKTAIEKSYALKGEYPELDDVRKTLEGLGIDGPVGRKYYRKEDHQAFGYVLIGVTKHDPNYTFPVLDNIEIVSADSMLPPPGPVDIMNWIDQWTKK
jgi:branched-chain amino acid transport system substrate-binding protein